MIRPVARLRPLVLLAAPVIGCAAREENVAAADTAPAALQTQEVPAQPDWTSLFDGVTLAGWEEIEFGGSGPVEVSDGRILLGMGSPMTGVRFTGEFPRDGYEIELDAARLLGNDFFCGLTFPVGEAHLTLVLGGWGGGLCGLSCIDREDAAHNATCSFHGFERGRTFHVRVRVASGRVAAWLDGELLVDLATGGRTLGLRTEVEPCKPLGLASYTTRAALSNLRWRPVILR